MNELKRVIKVMEYLIGQANSYHDDSASPEHAEAVELLAMFKSLQPPKINTITASVRRALN